MRARAAPSAPDRQGLTHRREARPYPRKGRPAPIEAGAKQTLKANSCVFQHSANLYANSTGFSTHVSKRTLQHHACLARRHPF